MQQAIVGQLGSGRGQFEIWICVQVMCLGLLSASMFPWDSKRLYRLFFLPMRSQALMHTKTSGAGAVD